MKAQNFNVWIFGDAHVGTDKKKGRESLAEALKQTEHGGEERGPPIPWDLALDVGDMSGGQGVPEDEEGKEVVRQLAVLQKHDREQIYSVCGNHDRSGLDEPEAWWWQKWIDPLGEHTRHSGVNPAKRPYPIKGTWERYHFYFGNVLVLMMSDINPVGQTIGRGPLGGNPGGAVREETFQWWKDMVEAHPDYIIMTAHHYVLKDTTVASGAWEGMRKDEQGLWKSHYHGYKEKGTPKGASYLYWVGNLPDAQKFETYLKEHPGSVDFWFGGHTHTNPDDRHGNKSWQETRWGCHFVNVASLTRYHVAHSSMPSSRLLTFQEGSDEARLRFYMHTSEMVPQGWYEKEERRLKLPRPFKMPANK